VYNQFRTPLAEQQHDATGLVDFLIKCKKESGLNYKLQHGRDGRLEQVFL
jgi:hypothetical protein